MLKLYHTTKRKNRESILEKGLIPFAKNGSLIKYPPRIFLTKIKDDIATMDFLNQWDDIDIWEVRVDKSKIKKDMFSHLNYHYYIEEPIKAKLVKHIPI